MRKINLTSYVITFVILLAVFLLAAIYIFESQGTGKFVAVALGLLLAVPISQWASNTFGFSDSDASDDSDNTFKLVFKILFIPLLFISIFSYTMDRVLMSVCFAAPLVIGIFYFYLRKEEKIIHMYSPPKEPEEPVSDNHGTAAWTGIEEFKRLIKQAPEDDLTGLWVGSGFIRQASGHLLTVASPGAGKGAALIIPNLLIKPCGSYVVTDPKGENACITARAQKAWGQKVYILDPWDEQGAIGAKHGIPASGFNPFDMLRMDMVGLPDDCEMIANYLIPSNPKVKDKYWEERSRSLLKLLMMHIVTTRPIEEQNFVTLFEMVRNDNESLAKLIVELKLNNAVEGVISAGAKEIEGLLMAPETFEGIISNAQNGTKLFESIYLRRSLTKSDFNPFDLPNGDCTVFVVIPDRYMRSHSAWLKIVIGLSLKAVNAKPKKQVNFFIDEAGVIGAMDDIQNAYAFGRGQNIRMWSFYQSLSQINDLYGEPGLNSFLNATKHLIAFNLNDQYSREYISKLLGDSTGIGISTSGTGYNKTYTSQGFKRPLMTPEEVGSCPDFIHIGEGFKITIEKTFYYNIGREWGETFKDLADPPSRIH